MHCLTSFQFSKLIILRSNLHTPLTIRLYSCCSGCDANANGSTTTTKLHAATFYAATKRQVFLIKIHVNHNSYITHLTFLPGMPPNMNMGDVNHPMPPNMMGELIMLSITHSNYLLITQLLPKVECQTSRQ